MLSADTVKTLQEALKIGSVPPPSVPAAALPTWTWFRSVSTGTEWWITRGKGYVDLSGSLVKATLQDGEDPQSTRLSLERSVVSGVVRARLTILETDAPDVEISGRLKRFCWKGGGREILILENGGDVVGVFRELDHLVPMQTGGVKPVGRIKTQHMSPLNHACASKRAIPMRTFAIPTDLLRIRPGRRQIVPAALMRTNLVRATAPRRIIRRSWPSLPAPASARTKSPPRSAWAAWARSIARPTRT